MSYSVRAGKRRRRRRGGRGARGGTGAGTDPPPPKFPRVPGEGDRAAGPLPRPGGSGSGLPFFAGSPPILLGGRAGKLVGRG